jgi:adenylylsulfate kinase
MLILIFTGLSGAGKSTLAVALQAALAERALDAEVIDGDVYRKTINKDLGFSESDRRTNLRRLMDVAVQKASENKIAIIAAINPLEDLRTELAATFHAKVIWIKCNLETLIKRDTKGLYKKALLPDGHPQKIHEFSGISHRYDEPVNPDLVIDTDKEDIEFSLNKLLQFVLKNIPQEIRNKE